MYVPIYSFSYTYICMYNYLVSYLILLFMITLLLYLYVGTYIKLFSYFFVKFLGVGKVSYFRTYLFHACIPGYETILPTYYYTYPI
jgi:hypothetical protein